MVSNALNGKGQVSQEMVDRIRTRAEMLGYRPSNAARAIKTRQTEMLGLVMPDLTNHLFPCIAQMLSIAAEKNGLGILVADPRGSPDEQSEALRRPPDCRVDGLVVVPKKGKTPDPVSVPTVVINTAADPQNSVSADHFGGGALAAEHIFEIGHRAVVVLGGDKVSEVQRGRIKGMTDVFGRDVLVSVYWGNVGVDQAIASVRSGATAILTTFDVLARRVRSEFTSAQLSMPDDVSLTGFDDMSFAPIMHPALTTVSQNVIEMAAHGLISFRQRSGVKHTHSMARPFQCGLSFVNQLPSRTNLPKGDTPNDSTPFVDRNRCHACSHQCRGTGHIDNLCLFICSGRLQRGALRSV